MATSNFPILKGWEGYTRIATITESWSEWVVIEYPPARRWLRIWSLPVPLIYVFPYVYFFIKLYREGETRYSKTVIHVYFGRGPLDRNTAMFTPFLPHFTCEEGLCNGSLDVVGSEVHTTALAIVERFWSRGFGISHLRWRNNISPADWRIHNPYRWFLFTLLSPGSVLELEMAGRTALRSFLEGATYLSVDNILEELREVKPDGSQSRSGGDLSD